MRHTSSNSLVVSILLVSGTSLVFLVFILILLRVISDKSYIQLAFKVIESQLTLQIKHYETIENYVKKTRVVVHDTKHHILALNTLLANDHFEEAKEYISALEVDLFAVEKFKVCEN